MSDDVVHFEKGDTWHMHWFKPVMVDGKEQLLLCPMSEAEPGDHVFIPGESCSVCPPEPPPEKRGTLTVVEVSREAGTITVSK